MCLACGYPFARFFEHSAAGSSDSDCDFGSGALPSRLFDDYTSLQCWIDVPLDMGANVRALPLVPLDSLRIGEARHPGPSLVHFGTSNPAGLRSACELGPGVWSFSETQLSGVTQKTCTAQLKSIAHGAHRDVRVYHGAPVQTRVNSTWAGSWSGVSVLSDFPGRMVTLPYRGEEFSSGRILVTQHFIRDIPVLVATVYGFPRGPTWPDAGSLNAQLLQIVSDEIIIGWNTNGDG